MRDLLRHSAVRAAGLRIGALVVLVGAAIGLRSGSPLDADDTPWRVSVLSTSSVAVAVLVVFVVALCLVVWAGTHGVPRSSRRAQRSSLASLFVLLVLVLLLVLLHPSFGPPVTSGPHPVVTATPGPVAGHTVREGSHTGASVLLLLALIAVFVSVVVAVVRSRQAATAVTEPGDLDEALSAGLLAASDVLRDRRGDVSPRERIVLAYAAFEQVLATRGVVRGRSGTPSALLERAVAAGAPAGPAAALTDLFSRARFSLEAIAESDVDVAELSLASLLELR